MWYGNAVGHLAAVESAEENAWLATTFGPLSGQGYWIAGRDNSGLTTPDWLYWAAGPKTGANLVYNKINPAPQSPWGCIYVKQGVAGDWGQTTCNSTLPFLVEFECPLGQELIPKVGCLRKSFYHPEILFA